MMHLLPSTKELLRSRVHELMVYLKFLRVAIEKDAHVIARNNQLQLPLDKSLTHMMKANVCLLLYSAMEACMVQLLDEMHDAIGQNCLGADQLNSQLFLTVARHFQISKINLTTDKVTSPLHEFLFNAWLVDWRDRNQREKRAIGLSGSVDSLAIFEKLRHFGVFSPEVRKPPAHLAHRALQSTKGRRNQLAHGELSFADLGQGLAFEEICHDARAVFRTLRRVAREVNGFLLHRRYLATHVLAPIEA